MIGFSLLFALLFAGYIFTKNDPVNDTQNDKKSVTTTNQEDVIYVSVFTHVEQPNGKDTPDFLTDENAFWEQRNLVVAFAEMLYAKKIGYNYQPDWTFIEAAVQYDHGTENTNGKNFLQYIAEDLNVAVDPHNHTGQSRYNYADVAYVIKKLGVEPSGVVGGFLAAPASASILETFWTPIHGNVYDYTWTATLLWGGATSGHQDEESIWASGIWKPKNAEHFMEHDENAPLPVIGGYRTDWEGLDALLAKQTNGELEAGKIYTISINAHQKVLSNEYIEEFAEKIESYQSATEEGKIQWVTFQDAYKIWQENYSSIANILLYESDGTEILDTKNELKEKAVEECGDGVCSNLERKKGVCTIDCDS